MRDDSGGGKIIVEDQTVFWAIRKFHRVDDPRVCSSETTSQRKRFSEQLPAWCLARKRFMNSHSILITGLPCKPRQIVPESTWMKITCEKYAGKTHRWSSNLEHCTRSSSSNKSFVAPRKRSSVGTDGDRVRAGGNVCASVGWPVVQAPIDWRL